MKRFVAMVLVLAMLLALGGTAGAGDTCDWCGSWRYVLVEEGAYVMTHLPQASSGSSSHFVDVYDRYMCLDCGESELVTNWYTSTAEPHTLVPMSYDYVRDGVKYQVTYDGCTKCQYKKNEVTTVISGIPPCSHSWDGMQGMYNPQFSYTKQAEWYVYSPYPGSTDHSVKLMWTVTCNTCGESVTNVRADYYAAEQCTYQNGVCTKCNGKQLGYTPPTPTPTPTKVPVTPAPVTQAPVTPAPATEVPVTPVPGGCSHETRCSQSPATWHQFDGANHIMIAVNHYRCDCGQVDYEDQVEALYPHQFVDGVCRLCGYVDANTIVSVTYSEHPHYERTEVYADGHTVVVENEAGYKLSRELCDKCYPVEFNADTLMEMALWAMDAYNTRDLDPSEYPEHLKDAVRFNDIDCLIVPQLTDDGKMCLTISFEGSKELFDDWIADLLTEANDEGMHTGIAHDFGRFINNHSEELFSLLNLVRESGGSIQITGHSYGGGMTQLMTYWLITEYDFPKDKLTAYTFASPIVLNYSALRDDRIQGVNVYNIINTNDIVPDVGISAGYSGWWDYLFLSDVVIEEVANIIMNMKMEGGVALSGCNLGTSYYLSGNELENSRMLRLHKLAQENKIEYFDQVTRETSQWYEQNGAVLDHIVYQHSMEMYMELVKAAIVGEQRGYMVNMNGETIVPDQENIKYYDDNLSFYIGKPEK